MQIFAGVDSDLPIDWKEEEEDDDEDSEADMGNFSSQFTI